MGIVCSQTSKVFQVPFGPLTDDGDLEHQFLNLKSHPEYIPVLPPCVGWPETQSLLRHINAPQSPFMSLAAAQQFFQQPQAEAPLALSSFVTLCFAEIEHNRHPSLEDVAQTLHRTMDQLLQDISTSLEQSLNLEVLLELQPTFFRDHRFEGWSLTAFLVVPGHEHYAIRGTWGWGIHALMDSLSSYTHPNPPS